MFGFLSIISLFAPIWSSLSLALLYLVFHSFIHKKNISITDEKSCMPLFWTVWSIGLFAFGATILAILIIDIPSISYLHSEWGVAPVPEYNFTLSLLTFGAIALLIFSLLSALSYIGILGYHPENKNLLLRVFARLYFSNLILFVMYYVVSTLLVI